MAFPPKIATCQRYQGVGDVTADYWCLGVLARDREHGQPDQVTGAPQRLTVICTIGACADDDMSPDWTASIDSTYAAPI